MANNQYSDLEVVPPSEQLDQQKFSVTDAQPTHPQPYADQSHAETRLWPKAVHSTTIW